MTSALHQEIFEQPAVIERLLRERADQIAAIGSKLASRDPRYLLIAARGTSDNAARYAQYLFGARNRLTVALAAPSLFGQYASPPRLEGAAVLGISQSGQSPDIVQVLEEARRQGVPTVAITNDAGSPLAAAADDCIDLGAGVERSVAATKTYTAQLVALAMLSRSLSPEPAADADLGRLPAALGAALDAEAAAQAAAARLAQSQRCVVIGRGFDYATTFELALKLKELTYVAAEPYSSADFQHGPIAMIEPGFPAVLLATGNTMRGELAALRDRLRERGAALVVLGDDESIRHSDDAWLPVPAGVPEWLSPCVSIVPGQLLAFHVALARGHDPDQPRSLNKVTLTR
jgi:glucosamine--fructose-6-phosphate aminotransferase (isomerizing)